MGCCKKWKVFTGIPHFIILCFIVLHGYCFFWQIEDCGSSEPSKSMGAIFLTVFAHMVSLCDILIILEIFQILLLLLLYLLLLSVISDL